MTRLPSLLAPFLVAVSLAACENEKPREDPAYLFESRVPLDPMVEALKKAGDDPSKALRPASATDLAKLLEPGKRYDYVVMPNNAIVIAPKSVESTANFWSHPILANGAAVKSAGHNRIEKTGGNLSKVIVDADSDTYCPLTESIRSTLSALTAMKVPADALRVESRTTDCWKTDTKAVASAAPAVPRASFGTVMLSVARRFEVLGRAHKAKRNDLALYELEELEETFKNEVPATPLPPLPPGVSIQPFLESMTSFNILDLRKALENKDEKAIATAYESMAKTCNGCHQAAARAYIEVPSRPGELVPKLDPKP
jgi:hypothetical protein